MKILFLDQYSDLGGAQQCLLALLPAVRELGWQAVVAAPGRGALLQRASQQGALIEDLPSQSYSAGKKSLDDALRFAWDIPALSGHIARLLKHHRPDRLYINGPRLIPAAAWLRDSTPPVIFHSHSFIGSRAAVALVGRSAARLHARVIGCCNFVAAPWRNYVPPDRVHVVYNGVADLRYRERPAGDEARIGIVGRIAEEKGQQAFVDAARILNTSFPNLQFQVIGDVLFNDAAALRYGQSVEQAAAGLPIRFLGWCDDLAGAFDGIDVLVAPSTIPEATTRVIPEAWSAGIPVVATALGGIAEIVRDDENGFLVPQPTPAALAARIATLLKSNPEDLQRVTSQARQFYERQFTISRYREQILSVCRQA